MQEEHKKKVKIELYNDHFEKELQENKDKGQSNIFDFIGE